MLFSMTGKKWRQLHATWVRHSKEGVGSAYLAWRSIGRGGIADKGRWLWSSSNSPKVLTSEVEHLRYLSEHLSADGTAPPSNQVGDGDSFASLKD
jgi:hypothetical protein